MKAYLRTSTSGSQPYDYGKNGNRVMTNQDTRDLYTTPYIQASDGSHTHTLNGDAETRPDNYTVRVWKRVS